MFCIFVCLLTSIGVACEGTGVGLALSQRIISSHDGHLTVSESELGGATFVVSLPSVTSDSVSRSSTSNSSKIGRVKALLVEDEPDVSNVMQKLLSSMNVDVTAADNAEDALVLLQQDASYDVNLCDLRMPGMGGLGMLTEIESRWPSLSDRFVFVTGDAISEDVKAIRSRATHLLLEKPVSPIELKSLIQSL